jgi:peroxiredoxin
LRSFQQRISDFDARGIRVVAISNDPPQVLKVHRARHGLTFPLLSDVNTEVIRRYDLLHAGAGPGHTDIARPGEFLIDRSGTVRWVNLTASFIVRARPEEVLHAYDSSAQH